MHVFCTSTRFFFLANYENGVLLNVSSIVMGGDYLKRTIKQLIITANVFIYILIV